MSLHLVPIRFRSAAAFVTMWHRYLQDPRGMVFTVGAADDDGVLRAVAIAGRPTARMNDDGQTLEVTRVATDGYHNACSLLYGACRRAGFALGYTRILTYNHTRHYGPVCAGPCLHASCHFIRVGETGISLRAAGWRVIAQRPPHTGWDRPSRPRSVDGSEGIPRTLWEATA